MVWTISKTKSQNTCARVCVCFSVYVCSSLHVCWYVCLWSLWTSPLWFLAGSEFQQLLIVKLLLVTLPGCTGRGEDRESLCHLSMARDVRRSPGMSIIVQTEDELLPVLSVTEPPEYQFKRKWHEMMASFFFFQKTPIRCRRYIHLRKYFWQLKLNKISPNRYKWYIFLRINTNTKTLNSTVNYWVINYFMIQLNVEI